MFLLNVDEVNTPLLVPLQYSLSVTGLNSSTGSSNVLNKLFSQTALSPGLGRLPVSLAYVINGNRASYANPVFCACK